LLAQHLERTVDLGGRDLLDRLVGELVDGPVLVGARTARVGIDRGARHERVVLDGAGEDAGGVAHPSGHARRGVDDRVPAPASQRVEIACVAVAVERLDVRVEVWARPPAVEERDLVPARERRLDEVAPDEEGAAEEQDPQPTTSQFTRHS
jgi:hypothetical protein